MAFLCTSYSTELHQTTTTQVPPATSACLSQVPIANMRMTTAAAPALSYKVSQAAPPLCHASQVSTASLSMADVISEWWRKTWCVWHALLAAGDLPVFLTQQLEALTVHNRYCDGCMVQPALPIQAATLLHQQKILLKHQMRLMNQQILNYQVWHVPTPVCICMQCAWHAVSLCVMFTPQELCVDSCAVYWLSCYAYSAHVVLPYS